SRQCALCAASTWPDSASATIQDRADRSFGSTGTPLARLTCVPGCPSRAPPTVDMDAGGVADGVVDGLGAARAAGAVSVVDSRTGAAANSHGRTVFLGAGTVGNVHATSGDVPPRSPPRARNRIVAGDTGRMP